MYIVLLLLLLSLLLLCGLNLHAFILNIWNLSWVIYNFVNLYSNFTHSNIMICCPRNIIIIIIIIIIISITIDHLLLNVFIALLYLNIYNII